MDSSIDWYAQRLIPGTVVGLASEPHSKTMDHLMQVSGIRYAMHEKNMKTVQEYGRLSLFGMQILKHHTDKHF